MIIAVLSLLYTNNLVERLEQELRKKVELWAEATRRLGSDSQEGSDINFLVKVIQDNSTIPVILTDEDENIISYKNIDTGRVKTSDDLLKVLEIMKEENAPIEINLSEGRKNFIFYKDTETLTRLFYYPYVYLSVIFIFIVFAYYAFSSSRTAEQNKVWVGLTKETAHQLGTPTSSMMAWVELLKMNNIDPETVKELEKDVTRLQKITERFSKIGSNPTLSPARLNLLIANTVDYLSKRFSERVKIIYQIPEKEIILPLNAALFEWVIENVCKNAYDAIDGEGSIVIESHENKNKVIIDVHDTGKGILKRKQKTIFKPGYTTKKTGWGLGLSLTKRIVENYHCGKIFVQSSEPGKGTTIRIILPKQTCEA